jgi:ketosteroid isomerase-like protein
MNLENTITAPESPAGNWQEKGLVYDDGSTTARSPQQILQSALTALREGNVSEVLELFADHFTFNDHLLTLQFTDKRHLREFFEKSRELFPDTALEIVSLFGEADHAVAQWKLAATQIVPCGASSYQFPVSLFGATIVRVEKERIVQWTDYHDQGSSRRMSLAAFFTKGI